MNSNDNRRGFTLIELLIVIGIIAILAGLLFPVIGSIRKSGRKAVTENLIQQIATAITLYIENEACLGEDNGSNFATKPWQYLSVRPKAYGQMAYLELQPKFLAGAGPDTILDPFGQPLIFTVTNVDAGVAAVAGGMRRYTQKVTIRSTCGSADPYTKDDIYYVVDFAGSRTWEKNSYP